MTTKALAKFTAELCYEKLSAHSIEMAKNVCWTGWELLSAVRRKNLYVLYMMLFFREMRLRPIFSAAFPPKRPVP